MTKHRAYRFLFAMLIIVMLIAQVSANREGTGTVEASRAQLHRSADTPND